MRNIELREYLHKIFCQNKCTEFVFKGDSPAILKFSPHDEDHHRKLTKALKLSYKI